MVGEQNVVTEELTGGMVWEVGEKRQVVETRRGIIASWVNHSDKW
jgi:hypothetical protein